MQRTQLDLYRSREMADPMGAVIRRRSRRLARLVWVMSFCALYLLSTPYLAARFLHSLESEPPIPAADTLPPGPQAIVILSAGLRPDAPEYGEDTAGGLTVQRLRYGAALHRRSRLPILVSGGRIHDGHDALATVMKRVLEGELGVPVRWTETRSLNTFENARETAHVLAADGVSSVFLVTHAWHMPRAAETFRAVGLTVIPAGTGYTLIGDEPDAVDFLPRSGALAASGYAIHEYVGRLWYHVAYY